MGPASGRQRFYRVGAIVFVVAAFAFAAFSVRRSLQPPPGGSEREYVTLVCLKCQAESQVRDTPAQPLAVDEETGAFQCPRCGAFEAYVASLRCLRCGRAVPRTPQSTGSPFVCPYCHQPLNAEGGEPAPSPEGAGEP